MAVSFSFDDGSGSCAIHRARARVCASLHTDVYLHGALLALAQTKAAHAGLMCGSGIGIGMGMVMVIITRNRRRLVLRLQAPVSVPVSVGVGGCLGLGISYCILCLDWDCFIHLRVACGFIISILHSTWILHIAYWYCVWVWFAFGFFIYQ
jgi:hypothetical protein